MNNGRQELPSLVILISLIVKLTAKIVQNNVQKRILGKALKQALAIHTAHKRGSIIQPSWEHRSTSVLHSA